MVSKTTPVHSSLELIEYLVEITAAWGSAGEAIDYTGETSRVEINNKPSAKWAIEYSIDGGEWVTLPCNRIAYIDVDMSTTTINVRRGENGPSPSTVLVSYFTKPEGLFADPQDPTELPSVSGAGTEVTATGTLPDSALGKVTPVNSGSATTQTLPSAATAWAAQPYGLVVLSVKGAGIPVFAAGAGDTLHATSGIPAGVQYGMIAAQVISATEWALA